MKLLLTIFMLCTISLPVFSQKNLAPIREKAYRNLDLAQQHADKKNWPLALKELNTLKLGEARLNPHEKAMMYNLLGFIAYSNEDLPEAISHYQQVIVDPSEVSNNLYENALYGLAQLHFGLSQYEQSIAKMKEWLNATGKSNEQALLLIAQSYYQLKQYEKAIEPLNEVILTSKDAPKENWLLLLRILYFENSQKELAVETMKKLVSLYPKEQYLMQLSALHGQLGQTKKQIAVLESLQEKGLLTDDVQILNLANLYLSEDMPFESSRVLNWAISKELLVKEKKVVRLLAASLSSAKEFSSAGDAFYQLYNITGDTQPLMQAAQNYWLNRDYKRVVEILKSQSDEEAIKLTAMSLFYLNDFDLSREAFNRLKKYNIKEANQWIALCNAEQSHRQRVKEYL